MLLLTLSVVTREVLPGRGGSPHSCMTAVRGESGEARGGERAVSVPASPVLVGSCRADPAGSPLGGPSVCPSSKGSVHSQHTHPLSFPSWKRSCTSLPWTPETLWVTDTRTAPL